MSNDDHSMVIFLMPFFLFMCNVGMCVSFSILLLFLIMASLGIAFQQDGRRQRQREQNMACKRRKKEKRAQDLMRIRERRNHLNAAVNRSNDVRSELSPPSTETTSPTWNALPTLHVDKCLRLCRGVRSSVHRHAIKRILMTISSILAVSNQNFLTVFLNATMCSIGFICVAFFACVSVICQIESYFYTLMTQLSYCTCFILLLSPL